MPKNNNQPKKPVQQKVHLANLFAVMRQFKPEMLARTDKEGEAWTGKFLVNERCGGPVPERDDLLRLIGSASIEMQSFMKEHSALCSEHSQALAAMMRMSAALDAALEETAPPDTDIVDRIQMLTDRYRQSVAVINNIANNIPPERAKEVASKFLKFKSGSLIAIETNNDPAKPEDTKT